MDAVRDKARDYILEAAFDRLASFFGDFFRGKKHYKTQLSELKVKLQSIEALVDDAEQKQFRDKRVREWLLKAKDVVFQIEDLSDEIDCEHSKCEVEAESQSTANKVRSFFKSFSVSSFEKEIESRMKQIRDDLDDLASQIDGLDLKKVKDLGVGSGSGPKVSHISQSTSEVVENVIYGRDDDMKFILNWLTSDTDKKPSILSIVGMGGVGKTTLAQHVYNDPRVEFHIKAWVCVSDEHDSDEHDASKITKKVLEAIINSPDDSTSLQMVQGRLKKELNEKTFLLVLDDVWSIKPKKWEGLLTALKFGAHGSKIVVTTRDNKVASNLGSNEIHPIRELQGDRSWQLFAKHAFQDDNLQPNLCHMEIGMKIVKKCKGLPLALKSMGSLLHNKPVSEWKKILKCEIWELEDSDIVPALALSYHFLPSHLKRCFAYCALFPKGYVFDKESLIQLWMAENFLQCHQQNMSPEEVGEQYFSDLLSRSFFQQSSKKRKCFIMHDLLNDLAKYVCEDICFRLRVDKANGIPKTTRHFSFATNDAEYLDVFGRLDDAERLHTFMPTCMSFINRWHCRMSIHELLSKFKFLHVLSLSGCSDLKEVPDFVGYLNHLRLLDLSNTEIKKLPDSTCSLSNLQILKLNNCEYLKELPLNLHELTSLRCLEIMHTELRKVPLHLGKLKNLQVLISSFDVGKSSEFTIQQLGELNLHGRLSIGELQNIENPLHAFAVGLKNIVELELEWNLDRNPDDSEKERDENVIKNLQPSEHLEKLSIRRYSGTEFPSWLSDNSLTLRNVVSLKLDSCQSCRRLPCLGDLAFLKDLEIRRLDGIVGIGADFHGCSSPSFTSLKKLKFHCMRGWEKWECQDVTGAFPRLRHLSISACPKLKGRLPMQLVQLVQLKKLSIFDCKHLLDGMLDMQAKRLSISSHIIEAWLLEGIGHIISDTCLKELNVFCCPIINIIPMSQSYDFLDSLTIRDDCDSLVTFQLDSFPTLGKLVLIRCPNLQKISQGRTHNHLRNLTIIKCLQLESLPQHMQTLLPSLEELDITDCPKVESGGLPSNLRHLSLCNCSKFIASPEMALGAHLSLKTLYVGEMDGESFPGEDLLPLSLHFLRIHDCHNLQHLPEGLCRLSSLQKLVIELCKSLECLPEGLCHLSSLQILVLEFCESLECLPEGLCHLSSLQKLVLRDCKSLKCLPECLRQLSSLQELVLERCPSLKCLPEGLCHLSSLQKLVLEFCESLECLPEGLCHLFSLKELVLTDCKSLKCLPEGLCHLSSLQKLVLRDCKSLKCLPECLWQLSSLQELVLERCPSLKCLPEDLCHLSSLQKLILEFCESLECLPESLCQLSSLQELVLEFCESLECLPEKGLPKSISTLQILDCPLLYQRCQEPEGEDWPKIAHIENLDIRLDNSIFKALSCAK